MEMKKYSILLLLISNGFSALWEVSSHLGFGASNSSYGTEVLNRTGYEAFNNPFLQLQTAVSRIQGKNLFGLDLAYAEGSVRAGKRGIDSNVINKLVFMGMNALGGRKLIETEIFGFWGTAEFGLGRFMIGLGPSDTNPWKYDSFSLNGNLGLESIYEKRFTQKGLYRLGAYVKGGVTKTFRNEGIYLPVVLVGVKLGIAFGRD
jgi:hypothetical protein